MSGHTKGPWRVVNDLISQHLWVRSAGGLVAKGSYPTRFPDQDERFRAEVAEYRANAHLIAAAPDLLDALDDMLAGWRYIRQNHGDLYGVGWDRCEQAALAALAKANPAAKDPTNG